jgi:surfactin synthase thioesterase subunit
LCAFQLPGRELRLREQPISRLQTLVTALAQATMPLLNVSYVLFGHSMGALVCFELARTLRRLGAPAPELLFVSAFNAPDMPNPNPSIHHLPDQQFIERVQGIYGGIPQAVLQEPSLVELVLPALRADFTLLETYRYRHEPALQVPIVCLGGDMDPQVSRVGLTRWREHTTKAYALTLFPGGHFFLQQERRRVLETLLHWIAPLL